MSVEYQAVLWNKQKKQYHKILWAGIGLLIISFISIQLSFDALITIETLIIRTSALVAIFLLHVILIIGPLCRLHKVFTPLLYNRRHLGVTMFLFAAIHGIFGIIQFHSLGDIHPIASVFISNTKYLAISQFPFQVLGFIALIILFIMAATSHDFWLKNLGPKLWKSIHMLVYFAYGLVIMHIALGILQYENHPVFWTFLVLGFMIVASLHIFTGIKEMKWVKSQNKYLSENGFYQICKISEISDCRAKSVFINDQNIAIFKYDDKISAVNNVCRHQMGPLSEGKIIDGCITCPWHGYQYLPSNGQSPPPFTEKLTTYEVKLVKNNIWLNPAPKPEGTYVEPANISI